LNKQIEREIQRCEREIAEIESRTDCCPAYLTVLGSEDWRYEKRILESLEVSS
jgi:hypothetical protein